MGQKFDIGGVVATRETEKALLCTIPNRKDPLKPREVWVPKSAIHDDSEVYNNRKNDRGRLVVHSWFAEKEKLEDLA